MAVQRHRHIPPKCTSITCNPSCNATIPERDCTKITQGTYRGDYMCFHDTTPSPAPHARRKSRVKKRGGKR